MVVDVAVVLAIREKLLDPRHLRPGLAHVGLDVGRMSRRQLTKTRHLLLGTGGREPGRHDGTYQRVLKGHLGLVHKDLMGPNWRGERQVEEV